MMTIDEAIQHSREKAKEKRKDYERACALNIPSDGCLECAEEHEQLAEWLEELKRYKAQKIMIKVDYDKAHTLKEILRHSQFGIVYPEDQYEVVPLVSGGPSDEELAERREADRWIPITMRPGTDEEYEDFCRYGDCPREDFRVFDCPTPDDEQEVLVTTRWGNVCIDIWHRDVDCCYFEDNCDDGDVIAWMPIPKPYKESGGKT